ncbi:MAG TPA: HAMP domain-containing sensor histidine kinase [Urbifossiella sp.]|nr:HAMP domain-containing sensor histidine kinase [Urbifossiella sp.]
MPRTAVGRLAADLPWLCPNTTGLVALAERPADLPALAAADPALLALLARFALDADGHVCHQRLHGPQLPDAAAAFLAHREAGWLDPLAAVVIDIDSVGVRAAERARAIAEETGRADPDAAEVAARLAPLGWYAIAAVDKAAAEACLRDPTQCQREQWGYDAHAVARRLVLRWRFPGWLVAALGGLNRPDDGLGAVVALAVAEAQCETIDLGLTPKVDAERLRARLASGPRQGAVSYVADAWEQQPADAGRSPSNLNPNPYRVPLLPTLLRTAADARRRNGAALVLRLEAEIDTLHARLDHDAADTDVQAAKLEALAEFAAGAGHEINNPLAVISGHAQRLMRTEQDDDRADSLRTVVRQTQRIAGILREVMQFARPPKPTPGRVRVADLFAAVLNEQEPFAVERSVRLEATDVPADATVDADAGQLRLALSAVVRNGIEAAGADGWVRLRTEASAAGVLLVVEDGGPGLTAEAAVHAFDPFYCGRPAGRGRGLGLSTAWRLARQNGGDLRHEPGDGPTRFVFTFSLAREAGFPAREAA